MAGEQYKRHVQEWLFSFQMNKQTHALYALIETAKLAPSEAVSLTLGDLHLAGNEPHVKIWNQETGQRRTVALTAEVRNALVSWLLIRPDRPITLLFPGEADEGLTPKIAAALLENFTPSASPAASAGTPAVTTQTIAEEGLPNLGPLPRQQTPPPFKTALPPQGPEKITSKPKTPPITAEFSVPKTPHPAKTAAPPFKTAPPSRGPEKVTPKPETPPVSAEALSPKTDQSAKTTPPQPETPLTAKEILSQKAAHPAETTPPKPASTPLPAANRRRSTANRRRSTANRRRSTANRRRSAANRRRSTANRRRSTLIAGTLAALICVGLVVGGIVFLPDQVKQLQGGLFTTPTPEENVAQSKSTITVMPNTATPTPVPSDTPTATNTATATASATLEPTSVSPISTPTLQPTDTPTATPTATPTPLPTLTPTPIPSATPSAAPTNTPAPPPPEATPEATATPTPGFKYETPQLLSPEPDYIFIPGNTLDLKWEPIGELAGNEQYAVRLVYFHNAELVYRGAQLKETQWTVPFELHRDADGPEYKYTWFIFVEEVQPDGAGKAISPESEHRSFTWK